jgi:hypothetical protein
MPPLGSNLGAAWTEACADFGTLNSIIVIPHDFNIFFPV